MGSVQSGPRPADSTALWLDTLGDKRRVLSHHLPRFWFPDFLHGASAQMHRSATIFPGTPAADAPSRQRFCTPFLPFGVYPRFFSTSMVYQILMFRTRSSSLGWRPTGAGFLGGGVRSPARTSSRHLTRTGGGALPTVCHSLSMASITSQKKALVLEDSTISRSVYWSRLPSGDSQVLAIILDIGFSLVLGSYWVSP